MGARGDFNIACHACNLFTTIGFYPVNALLTLLFVQRVDAIATCYDLIRYQWGMFVMFVALVVWRVRYQSHRYGHWMLAALITGQMALNWLGYCAVQQAIDNFRHYDSVMGSSERDQYDPAPDPLSLVYPPSPLSLHWPGDQYYLSDVCGHGFSINFVRLVIVNIGFTGSGCLAYTIRLVMHHQPKALTLKIERMIDRAEDQWEQIESSLMRIKDRLLRRDFNNDDDDGDSDDTERHGLLQTKV